MMQSNASRILLTLLVFLTGMTVMADGIHAQCNECDNICQVGWHLDVCDTALDGWSGLCVSRCEPGNCSSVHPQDCGVSGLTPGEVRTILAAVEAGDIQTINLYLRTSDDVMVNTKRSALQITACRGGVIASVTIPAAMVVALIPGASARVTTALADGAEGRIDPLSTLW